MSTHRLTGEDIHSHEDVHDHFSDLVLLAEAEKEAFEPVQVITLQQYYKEKAYDKAWGMVDSVDSVEAVAQSICDDEYATGKEFVEIQKTRVIIGINAKTVTDSQVDRALQLLVSIDDFTPGEFYYFGEDQQIHYEFTSEI